MTSGRTCSETDLQPKHQARLIPTPVASDTAFADAVTVRLALGISARRSAIAIAVVQRAALHSSVIEQKAPLS